MTKVGTAYIDVDADLDPFERALRRHSKTIDTRTKGIGKNVARNLTGGVAAAGTAAFAAITIEAVRATKAYVESNKVSQTTKAHLKSIGHEANITAKGIATLAAETSRKTGVDDEAIQTGSNLLLTFKDVHNEVGRGNQIFDRATKSAVDLSASGFGSIDSAAKQLGKALNDPIKGITALNRSGVTFTQQQKDQIKTLVEHGDKLRAQKIIMREVEAQVKGTAAAQATGFDRLKVSIENIEEGIGSGLAPVAEEAADQLDKIAQKVTPALEKAGKEIDRIFDRKDLDLGEKIELSAAAAKRNLRPLIRALGDTIDDADLEDKLLHAIDKAFPMIAENAAQHGPKVAGAFVRGFIHADGWGKVAALSFVAWKTGAIGKLGSAAAGKFAERFAITAGADIAAESAAGGTLGGGILKKGKWGSVGGRAGKIAARGFVIAALAELALHREEIQDKIKEIFGIGGRAAPYDVPGTSEKDYDKKGTGEAIIDQLFGGILRQGGYVGGPARRRGMLQKLRAGGFAQAMVSPGELLAFPGGGAAVVPGPRVAADSVHATLPVGTAVFTGHGQQLLAQGASPAQALARQLPHFKDGGRLDRWQHRYPRHSLSQALNNRDGWAHFSSKEIRALAEYVGFGPGRALQMAQIARGESMGYPGIVASDMGLGLMQITPTSAAWGSKSNPVWDWYRELGGFGGMLTPLGNMKMAKRLYEAGGLSPWHGTKFLGPLQKNVKSVLNDFDVKGGAGGGGWPHQVHPWDRRRLQRGIQPDAFSSAFEAARGGAGIRGIRSGILGAVRDTIPDRPERHRSSFKGDPSTSTAGGLRGVRKQAHDLAHQKHVSLAVSSIALAAHKRFPWVTYGSGRRPGAVTLNGNRSNHADGYALDLPAYGAQNLALGSWIRSNFPPGIRGVTEGVFDQNHDPTGQHGTHVHVSARGAVIPKALNYAATGHFRRGGIAGYQGGGLVRGYSYMNPGTLAGVGTHKGPKAKALLLEYSRDIDELAVGQLAGQIRGWRRAIREMFQGGLTRHEAAAVGRMRGAISLVQAEAGQRTGRFARRADRIGARAEHQATLWDRHMRAAGMDPSSLEGLNVGRLALKDQIAYQRDQRRELQRAFRIAKKAGNSGVARQIREEIREVDDAIAETVVQKMENAVEIVTAKGQAIIDRTEAYLAKLTGKIGLTQAGFSLGESAQQLAGTYNTTEGIQARIGAIKTQLIPALEGYGAQLRWNYGAYMTTGQTDKAAETLLQILDVDKQVLDANNDIKTLTEQIAEAATARLGLQTDTAGLLFTGMEINQRKAGTYDTPEGRAARAGYITDVIIPALTAQLNGPGGVIERWLAALKTPDPLDEIQIWNEGLSILNTIGQYQADAKDLLTAVVDNTANLTELLDLQRQDSEMWRRRFNVSQAQYPVLAGQYAKGGVVPGPVGGRTYAAGGTVSENSTGDGTVLVTVVVKDGAVDASKIEAIAQKVTRDQARAGARGLPGKAGVMT